MIKKLKPERTAGTVYEMDFRKEYESGIRGLIFDIDNTLVAQNAPLSEEAAAFLKARIEEGFRVCLVSNNREKRVREFAENTGAGYVHNAAKPSRKGYYKAMELMGTDTTNTLFVGDQVLTDIFGANRAGVKNVLAKPVDPKTDTAAIRFKRFIERIFLGRGKRRNRRDGDEKNT